MPATPAQPPRGRGRPPTGLGGEYASRYPQLTVRLPPPTMARLDAWSAASGRPAWKLISRLVDREVGRMRGPAGRTVRDEAAALLRKRKRRPV